MFTQIDISQLNVGNPVTTRLFLINIKESFDDHEQRITNASTGSIVPTGTLVSFGFGSIPVEYLAANGQAVSRITYAALFAVIGVTYGIGDGVNTFNVPDLKGRTPIGAGTSTAIGGTTHSIGQKKGDESHLLTTSEMPTHGHTNTHYHEIPNHTHTLFTGSNPGTTRPLTASLDGNPTSINFLETTTAHPELILPTIIGGGNDGGSTQHENRMPEIALNWGIKV